MGKWSRATADDLRRMLVSSSSDPRHMHYPTQPKPPTRPNASLTGLLSGSLQGVAEQAPAADPAFGSSAPTAPRVRSRSFTGSPGEIGLMVGIFGLVVGSQLAMVIEGSCSFTGDRGNVSGSVLIGSCMLAFYLSRLIRAGEPTITVDKRGYHDRRVSSEPIPWPSIEHLSVRTYKRYNYAVLRLRKEARGQVSLRPWHRLSCFFTLGRVYSAAFGVDATIMQLVNAAQQTAHEAGHPVRFVA